MDFRQLSPSDVRSGGSDASPAAGAGSAESERDRHQHGLAALLGNLPGMVYACRNDAVWTLTFVSDGCREVTGYEPDELLNSRVLAFRDLVHPDDRGTLWSRCQTNLEKRLPCRNEHRIVDKSGQVRWVSDRAIGVYAADGSLDHIEGFIQDITLEKKLELERTQAETRLREAVSASRMVWWEWDLTEGGLRLHAFGATCILGYACEMLQGETGETWMLKVHPDDRPEVEASLQSCITGPSDEWTCEHRLLAAGGAWIWIRQIGRVTRRHPDGRAAWMTGTTQDIHVSVEAERLRIETERALRLSNEQRTMAIESARLGTCTYDLATGSFDWNDRMFELTGLDRLPSREEFDQAVHPEDRPKLARHWEEITAGAGPFAADLRFVHRDRKIRHVHIEGRVYPGADGQPARASAIYRDVTEEMETRELARVALLKADQAKRLETLGHFAGGIAHDFNNLLTGILGSLELAELDLQERRDPSEPLHTARKAALRSQDLVARLLMFARGDKAGSRRTVDLRRLVKETSSLIAVTLPRCIHFHLDLPPQCPAVEADDGQIMQVLMNLCINASHAIGENLGSITITLAAVNAGSAVRLSVADTGCGMDVETQRKLFQPFFTTKEPGRGTGFGLSVVQDILRQHGAILTVRSAVGQGTTFEMTFPAIDQPPVAAPSRRKATRGGDSGRVLVVDDEPVVLDFLAAALRAAGYEVTSARHPKEALDHLASSPAACDALITDLSMPGLNGYELIQRVRGIKPGLPVVLMSGDFGRYPTPSQPLEGVKWLNKPISIAELLKRVPKKASEGTAPTVPPA